MYISLANHDFESQQLLKMKAKARCWWLMPLILEIRRITVGRQPRQIVLETLSQK
jgi:hypothetical protein